VACLKVTGNRAIIGTKPDNFLLAVQDEPDRWGMMEAPTNPPSCSSVPFDQFRLDGFGGGSAEANNFVAHDTP
jgi:hypothetical protein